MDFQEEEKECPDEETKQNIPDIPSWVYDFQRASQILRRQAAATHSSQLHHILPASNLTDMEARNLSDQHRRNNDVESTLMATRLSDDLERKRRKNRLAKQKSRLKIKERETDTDRLTRLKVDREAQQKNRAKIIENETDTDRLTRLELNRKTRYESRSRQTPIEKIEHREANRNEQQKSRSRQTPNEKIEHRETHRKEEQKSRSQRTPKEKIEHRETHRKEEQKSRSQRTSKQVAEQNQKKRQAHSNDFFKIALNCDVKQVEPYQLGPMEVTCRFCEAVGYASEVVPCGGGVSFGKLCCNQGDRVIETFRSQPEDPFLLHLYSSNDAMSKFFRTHVRSFNSNMGMASFVGKQAPAVKKGPPRAYTVQGQMRRMVGPMYPKEGDTASFLQVYFFDAAEATKIRENMIPAFEKNNEAAMRHDILFELHKSLMNSNNSYIKDYITVKEFIDKHPHPIPEYSISMHADHRPEHSHARNYNLPSTSEVSILLPADIKQTTSREVVCNLRGKTEENNIRILDHTHRSYDPMAYPLMFPSGRDGWNIFLKSTLEKHVSLLQYVKFHTMIRKKIGYNPIHHLNKLSQQWIVDQYCKHEQSQMKWLAKNQKKIRADQYHKVQDNIGADDITQTGVPTILPSSHTGSPRYMHQQCQDAMAIVRDKGKPDLFITFTANPDWHEVKRELRPGQTAQDRSDIVTRVFNEKKKQLLKELKQGAFGRVIGRIHSIEFQKRGLPHMHLLLFIENFIATPELIDQIICAEIPPLDSPIHDIVTKSYIHGPCKGLDCWDSSKNECTRHYPMTLRKTTELGENAFPNYRRRGVNDGGQSIVKVDSDKRSIIMDNSSVVPYNPYLTARFQSHCNVEYCASVKSIKYVVKYQLKGQDMATVSVDANATKNELIEFQQFRYVSATYAYWRFYEYEICSRYPAVMRLPVHLKGCQMVIYDEENVIKALENAETTKLTAFFQANIELPGICDIFYNDMPKHCVWDHKKKKWKLRVHGVSIDDPMTIGRIITIHPSQQELFCLRQLLVNVKGATSYNSIMTVNGVQYETFKATCIALGLLESDKMWMDCMEDIVHSKSASMCRKCFSFLLLYCTLSEPFLIYETFKNQLCDDFLNKFKNMGKNYTEAQCEYFAINELLCDLDKKLSVDGNTCVKYGLPKPDFELHQKLLTEANEKPTSDEILFAQQYYDENYEKMNEDQQELYDLCVERIQNEIGGVIFCNAPAGTGKTFVINLILSFIRKGGNIAYGTASSGIAACMIHSGTTFHYRFKIPIPVYDNSFWNLNLSEVAHLRKAKIIIIDEGPMLHKFNFEALDRSLKQMKGNDQPFGGKLILICGDFRQILPIVPRGNRASIVNASLKKSYLWDIIETKSLTINMRIQAIIKENPQDRDKLNNHSKWLLDVGTGNAETVMEDIIKIPNEMWCESGQAVVEKIYANFNENVGNLEYCRKRAILTTTNKIVDDLNDLIISKVNGEQHTYTSIDKVSTEDQQTMYPEEFLNSIEASGLPQHTITLKENTVIILLRNMDTTKGHCNGTRYLVICLSDFAIEARRLDALPNEENILIPRIPMNTKEGFFPFILIRLQFPVKPAFVITFSRAQGQSLAYCGMILPNSVFTHGQMYVGLSRCGNPDNIAFWQDQEEFELLGLSPEHMYTRNVVYTEIFQ